MPLDRSKPSPADRASRDAGANGSESSLADRVVGYGAGAVAVTIWAAWIVWTRGAVTGASTGGLSTTPLSAIDVGLLRFGVPAVLLAPVWLRFGVREGFKPARTSWASLLAMLGWGAPFVLLITAGMAHAPAAHVGALVPGSMPLWAALIGWLLFAEGFSPERKVGLALILTGASLVIVPALANAVESGVSGPLAGAPWLMAASACWACFSIGFARSGIGAVRATGLVAGWSTSVFLVLALWFGTSLPALPLETLLFHLTTQGLLSGAAAILAYTVAIERLGGPRAASLSCLVPVLAALLAVPMLGEALGALDTAAIVAASLGVAVVNGAIRLPAATR
ncbi:MAG: DMT family transporter [Pseudomonadota bacterium]